jgi:hypothetical protein
MSEDGTALALTEHSQPFTNSSYDHKRSGAQKHVSA